MKLYRKIPDDAGEYIDRNHCRYSLQIVRSCSARQEFTAFSDTAACLRQWELSYAPLLPPVPPADEGD